MYLMLLTILSDQRPERFYLFAFNVTFNPLHRLIITGSFKSRRNQYLLAGQDSALYTARQLPTFTVGFGLVFKLSTSQLGSGCRSKSKVLSSEKP